MQTLGLHKPYDYPAKSLCFQKAPREFKELIHVKMFIFAARWGIGGGVILIERRGKKNNSDAN